jgi:hypothetical protein
MKKRIDLRVSCISCKHETYAHCIARHKCKLPKQKAVRLTLLNDSRVESYASKSRGNPNIGRCKNPEDEILRRKKISMNQNSGGYREGAGRSKKFYVTDSYGSSTCLQSTYELTCMEVLNKLKINWLRPKALKYDNKNYFADFYLPDHQLWLDPKNDYKARLDKEKIQKVCQQNSINVVILLKDQLTEEFISNLVGRVGIEPTT